LEDATTTAHTPPGATAARHSLSIVFPILPPGENDSLEGIWRYGANSPTEMRSRRAGSFDRAARKIEGRESWRRVAATIAYVAGDRFQPSIKELSTRRFRSSRDDEPHYLSTEDTRREHGADAIGTYWLSVVGQNLPVAPGRKMEIEFLPEEMPVTGEKIKTVEWTGRTRPNEKYPFVLDIQVVLRRQIDGTAKKFWLNGAPGIWSPDLPEFDPIAIRYIRKASETEFETADSINIGDVFYVEAEYEEPPAAQRQLYLTRTGSGDGVRFHLERKFSIESGEFAGTSLDSDAVIYRSPRLLLLKPGDPDPDQSNVRALNETGLAKGDAVVLRAWPNAKLETAELDEPDSGTDKMVAEAKVRQAPPSLWDGALRRARRCWESGQSQTEFTNYTFVDGEKVMTIRGFTVYRPNLKGLSNLWRDNPVLAPIGIGDADTRDDGDYAQQINVKLPAHAAAILVHDELKFSLQRYIRGHGGPNAVASDAPEADRRRWIRIKEAEAETLIRLAEQGGNHALFHIPVMHRHGSIESELRRFLVDDIWQYDDRLPATKRAFLDTARLLISQAEGKLLQRSSQTLPTVRNVDDCDIKQLLYQIRAGMEPVVQRLTPKLMRPRRGDEPAYPRHVPDRVARANVAGVHILAQALQAQEDYASADTDVLLAIGAIVGIKANAALRAHRAATAASAATSLTSSTVAAMVRSGMTAMEIYDAYQVYKDMNDWRTAVRDTDFAWGASSVAGTERLTVAQEERRAAALKAALGGAMSIAPPLVDGIASGRLDLDVIPQSVQSHVTRQAARSGVESLGRGERLVFEHMARRARRAAGSDRLGDVSPADRLALQIADAAEARRTADATAPPARVPSRDGASAGTETGDAAPSTPPREPTGGDPPATSTADNTETVPPARGDSGDTSSDPVNQPTAGSTPDSTTTETAMLDPSRPATEPLAPASETARPEPSRPATERIDPSATDPNPATPTPHRTEPLTPASETARPEPSRPTTERIDPSATDPNSAPPPRRRTEPLTPASETARPEPSRPRTERLDGSGSTDPRVSPPSRRPRTDARGSETDVSRLDPAPAPSRPRSAPNIARSNPPDYVPNRPRPVEELGGGANAPPSARANTGRTGSPEDLARRLEPNIAQNRNLDNVPLRDPRFHTRPSYDLDVQPGETLGRTWDINGQRYRHGKLINPVSSTPPAQTSPGLFADVFEMVDDADNIAPIMGKRYGTREPWRGTGRRPSLDTSRAQDWEMADDIEFGAGLLERHDILQLELRGVDYTGEYPVMFQRRLGHDMPDGIIAERTPDEIFTRSRAGSWRDGRLKAFRKAYLKLRQDLARAGIGWEDGHLGNIFYQMDTRGPPRAGILDTDRMGPVASPRPGRQPGQFFGGMAGKWWTATKRRIDVGDAQEMAVAGLFHKGFFKIDSNGNLADGLFPVDEILEFFPALKDMMSRRKGLR
ncbi:MAG: hypothetical protein HOK82_18295, partial [Rhodospirillaceae bacterium]|nr:hypothetical protein [Rhodospirillaceae bacterium]